MKYLKQIIASGIILLAFLIPNITHGAFNVGWNATSTETSWISPNLVYGVLQTITGTAANIWNLVTANRFTATSTSQASIFPYASTTALSSGTIHASDANVTYGPTEYSGFINGSENATPTNYVAGNTIVYRVYARYSAGEGYYYSNVSPDSNTVTITLFAASVNVSWDPADTTTGLVDYLLVRNLNGGGFTHSVNIGNVTSVVDDNGGGTVTWTASVPTVNTTYADPAGVRLEYFRSPNTYGVFSDHPSQYNYFAGRVGISSTTPGSIFSVGSTTAGINIYDNATSTFGTGINLRTGCFAIRGTCVGTNLGTVTSVATNNGLTGGTITGAGTIGLNTAGFLTNGLLTWNGSNLVATGTPALTVGYLISTSTTASTFAGAITSSGVVTGTGGTFTGLTTANGAVYATTGGVLANESTYTYNPSTDLLTVANVAVTDTNAESFRVGSASAGVINMGTSNITAGAFTGGLDITLNTNGGMRIIAGSNTNFQTFSSGYSADTTLQGDMYFDYGASGNANGQAFWRNLARSTETVMQMSRHSLVGIGTTAQTAVLHVASTTSGVQDLFKAVGGAAENQGGTLVFTGGGNTTCANCLGIGTTSPYAKLSVNGRGIFNQDVRADYFTATSTSVASSFQYASTTQLSVSGNTYLNGYVGAGVAPDGVYPIKVGGNGILSTAYTVNGGASFGAGYFYAGAFTTMQLQTYDGAVNNRLTIEWDTGDVGIGDTTPDYDLDVAGKIRATGLVDALNFVATSTTATSTIGVLDLDSAGTSKTVGNATLVAPGTVTVTTGAATSNSFLMLTRKTSGGTPGTAVTYTITNGSFTITSDSALDTSTFTWLIIN